MAVVRSNVVVWGEDLKAGRLPHVSPLSGEPADVPRKYRYRTAPAWSWLLIVGGILVGVGWIPGIVIMLALSKRAAGDLFLTQRERRSIQVKLGITYGLLAATIGFFILAFTVPDDLKALMVLGALIAMVGWIICILAVMPLIRPRATVREIPSGATTVELKKVHPAFAEAVAGMYQQAPAIPDQAAPPALRATSP